MGEGMQIIDVKVDVGSGLLCVSMPYRKSRGQTPLTLIAASRPPASQTLSPSTMAVLSFLKGQLTLKNISLLFRHYSPLGAVVWMLNSPERPKHERVGMGVLLGRDGHFERQGLMEGKPW